MMFAGLGKSFIYRCLYQTVVISGLFFAVNCQAQDMVELYQQALQADKTFQAARSRFQAEAQAKPLGLASSLPQLSYSFRWMQNDYQSNQPTLNISDAMMDTLYGCQSDPDVFNCLAQGLIGHSLSKAKSRYRSTESNVLLTQVLYDPEVSAQRKIGQVLALKAAAELSLAQKELLQRVASSYFSVLKAKIEIAYIQQGKTLLTQQLDYAQALMQQGIGKAQEVQTLATLLQQQEFLLRGAQSKVQLAQFKITQLSGDAENTLLLLSDKAPVMVMEDSTEALMATANAHNDGLLMAKMLVELATLEVKKQQQNRLPRVMAAASYYESELRGGQGFQPASTSTAIGLEVRLPLYHGGALHHASKQAAYREVEAQDSYLAQQEQLHIAVMQAYLSAQELAARYHNLQFSAEQARLQAEQTQASYEAGAANLMQWYQAQKQALDSQFAKQIAHIESFEAALALKQVLGSLALDDLRLINQWLVRE